MTITDDQLARALLQAWAAWDEHPARRETAVAMEAACRAYAPTAVNQLRTHLAAARRAGASRQEALETWRPPSRSPPLTGATP